MRLLICLVTHNRLKYTQRTLYNLWHTISDEADYYLIVSDNASTDGTREYLPKLKDKFRIDDYVLHEQNFYPGKACNLAWQKAMWKYKPTHLMRLDNDMELTKGWDLKVEQYFRSIPLLGQLGLDHEAIETPEADLHRVTINDMTINEWPGCVGGPMVMPKHLWDKGVRYDESPWSTDDLYSPPMQEDSKLSHRIKQMGYLVGHAQEQLGKTFANETNWYEYPDYYKKTFTERGYGKLLDKIDKKGS